MILFQIWKWNAFFSQFLLNYIFQLLFQALFSQDGWGGSNVKQDSAWNVEGIPAPTNAGLNQPAPVPGGGQGGGNSGNGSENSSGGKESNTWGAASSGHRNDGTDLWRVTLSGQPPAAKPQPNNAWNHTPQNNTDFKQWGKFSN